MNQFFRKNFLSVLSVHSRRSISVSMGKAAKVKVGNIELNYESCGKGTNGKVALCMPGAMGSAETDFTPQLKDFGADDLLVIAWDPPGYGRSRPPVRDFSTNFFERDADAAADLMKVLGHEKYSLLGWSDGGITALIHASKYAQNVDKLVVWGANAYTTEADLKLFESIRDINKWSERMRAPMEAMYGKEYFKNKWEEWVDAMVRIYKEDNGDICRKEVSKIICPTLIIHGAKDSMVSEEHPAFLKEQIKNSRLVTWEDGKHNLHIKYSQRFNELVRSFLFE